MRVEIDGGTVTVTRTPGDRRFRKGGWGSAESGFWHALRNVLRAQGKPCIKKRMWKDGHLTDDSLFYTREPGKRPTWCIHDPDYALRDLAEDFNREGKVTLCYAVL